MPVIHNIEKHRWTREENILAFELYCVIPKNEVTPYNAKIIALASAIGTSPNSVKALLQNFKSFDPSYTADGRVGLSHGSSITKKVAEEFIDNWDDLVLTAQDIKTQLGLKDSLELYVPELETFPIGCSVERMQKVRVGQTFFRQTLLSAYGGKCCITGLGHQELLRASHIKPWKESNDKNEKANPQNGLLLNALHDIAFDRGLITINKNFEVVISCKLRECTDDATTSFFTKYDKALIVLPDKFKPDRRFIEYHNDMIFLG